MYKSIFETRHAARYRLLTVRNVLYEYATKSHWTLSLNLSMSRLYKSRNHRQCASALVHELVELSLPQNIINEQYDAIKKKAASFFPLLIVFHFGLARSRAQQ